MADVPATVLITVAAITASAGIAGVIVGGFLNRWNDRRKARLEHAKQQLSEFYSPVLSLRRHIRALSELRATISDVASTVYLSGERQARPRQETASALNGLTQFDNEQMKGVLLPMYREIMTIFREKYWLADTEVQEHYGKLVEYVELWQRNFDKTIPGDIVVEMRVEEKKLQVLYDALENRFRRLQRMLEQFNPDAE